MVYKEGGGAGTVDTSEEEQQSWSASDQEVWISRRFLFKGYCTKIEIQQKEFHGMSVSFD